MEAKKSQKSGSGGEDVGGEELRANRVCSGGAAQGRRHEECGRHGAEVALDERHVHFCGSGQLLWQPMPNAGSRALPVNSGALHVWAGSGEEVRCRAR